MTSRSQTRAKPLRDVDLANPNSSWGDGRYASALVNVSLTPHPETYHTGWGPRKPGPLAVLTGKQQHVNPLDQNTAAGRLECDTRPYRKTHRIPSTHIWDVLESWREIEKGWCEEHVTD